MNIDHQRSRYIDLLLAKAEEQAGDVPVREQYFDRIEAMIWPPAVPKPAPAPLVMPKRHSSDLGWPDLASGLGLPAAAAHTQEDAK